MDSIIDINLLRALSTVLLFIAFIAICIVVFSRKRKSYYEDAAMLPFGEEGASRRQVDSGRESSESSVKESGNLGRASGDSSPKTAKGERA
ncbi:MAG: cbb3-type cytochrome oxidase subunit 3 [Pseudomonadales bacterium]